MSFVKPPPFHTKIRESEQGLEIEVRRRRPWYRRLSSLFVLVFLAGNVLGFIAALGYAVYYFAAVFPARPQTGDPFVPLLCLACGALGMAGILICLVLITWREFQQAWTRQEIVRAGETHWQIERIIGRWTQTRRYAISGISNVHRAGHNYVKTWRASVPALFEIMTRQQSPSGLVLHYGRASVNFAVASTEAEARQIMEALRRRYPDLCQPIAERDVPQTPLTRNPWEFEGDPSQFVVRLTPRRRRTLLLLWATFMLPTAGLSLCCTSLLLAAADFSNTSRLTAITWVTLAVMIMLPFVLSPLRELLWLLRGAEVITLTPNGIVLAYERLAVSPKRSFVGDHITALRFEFSDAVASTFPSIFRWPGMSGALAFDYGAGTFRFGQDLTPAEANALVRQILDRFPQYGRDDMIPIAT
jgi:hypothetical protein